MKLKKSFLIYMLFILVFGCSESDSNSNNEEQVEESVFDAQTEALDKAEAIEQLILDAAAQQRQTIEDHGG